MELVSTEDAKWIKRVRFVQSHKAFDADGFEFGLCRIKFTDGNEPTCIFWCLTDGSDIDKAMQDT